MSISQRKKFRQQDPHFARESAQYDNPLPSREYILACLAAEGVPLMFEEVVALMHIEAAEVDLFARRLRAMEREAQVMRNRRGAYMLPERASLLPGKIQGHPDGYGFLIPDDASEDIYLDQHQMRKVLHGDRALVRVTGLDRKGRKEGAIVEVTDRANHQLVGRVQIEHGVVLVIPENRRITQDILIPPDKKQLSSLSAGQIVMVEIIEQPNKFAKPIGRIKEVLGNYADPGMEIEIALRKHDLPFEFSAAVLAENKALPEQIAAADRVDREDLTDLPLVTIDGETARDFDDAVFCEKRGARWRLVVAIADVSHYVRPGMALDKEAFARGNSVYFPRRVIPMLPEKLSNGICSLNPNVERLAMVCDMEIMVSGRVSAYRFYPAVFRSKARLTYNQVWGWLTGESHPASEEHQVLLPHLQNLHKLYGVLRKAREKRGAIDFETAETQMLFNEQGKIEQIVPVVRNDAHRIIEECMLAANVSAADFLNTHKQEALYRIHEAPSEEKLANLRAFMGEFGLQLPGGETATAKDFSQLLAQIKPRPDFELLQTVMLRSLRQAMYSPDVLGHFGLAYEHYTHFTSPIRRYPDLLVHRAIKAILAKKTYLPHLAWEDMGLHCSATERRADEATRDVQNWLKCFYMKDRIGDSFEGTISAVTAFGVFVALDEVFVEGLVHVSDLGADYFQFDPVRHQMLGERTGQRFRLGDRVRIRVARVDMAQNKIDFVLAQAFQGRETRGDSGTTRRPAREVPSAVPPATKRPAKAKAKVGALPSSNGGNKKGAKTGAAKKASVKKGKKTSVARSRKKG